MSVYLLATLDTKGEETRYVRDRLAEIGTATVVVDTGCIGTPSIRADITREELFAAAGSSLEAMVALGDRGEAVSKAADGARAVISQRYDAGDVEGVLGLGGSAGTMIGTAAMRALPLGVPKIMVSTLASGDVRAFVGDKDILMLNSIVDILGLNRISRAVLSTAAHAMAGMVQFAPEATAVDERPLVAATMFGVTTACVERARQVLETAGYEVIVFHATGNGGQAMESLIREGLIAGVLDVTTTELADELVGGVLSAGPQRLTAAAERGIPQVVSVGATDMVNFWAKHTVPAEFRDRNLHKHNDNVTLMRTTADENVAIGSDLGRKLSRATAAAAIFLPTKGVSAIDHVGQPFDDPVARQRLFDAIRNSCGNIEVIEMDDHINDSQFAEAMAVKLLAMMRNA